MKVDVEKLIDQIRKHPEIYNPDHKDFSNKEIRNNIFNTIISKEMNGIKGEILDRKWNKVLTKYASFIRKLSNDDSSETVLERFMEWPWTKHMRIFKPYVRKQFQISEFQSAIQIPEMDPDELPDIPLLMPSISLSMPRPVFSHSASSPRPVFPHPLSMPRPDFHRSSLRPNFSRPVSTPRQEFSHPLSMPRPEFPSSLMPVVRPEFAHAASRIEFQGSIPIGADYSPSVGMPQFAHGMTSMQRIQLPAFVENVYMSATSSATDGNRRVDNGASMLHDIASMMGLDQPSDEDGGTDTDESVDTADEGNDTDGETEGQSAAKKSRLEEKSDNAAAGHENDDVECNNDVTNNDQQKNDKDLLPDLPLPKPLAERGPSDFTAQEHIFLAWAKTMSTFTAKRQATIKMQINKIMSEAEFEDLDDEFFAANAPLRRPIYTSRL